VLLWGKKAEAFNNDYCSSDIAEETELMRDWRHNGPLGVLLGVVNYIKTPQQYALFEKFQRLAQSHLPTEKQTILEPVKPVVTRWNSYYSCFKRAVELQAAVSAYANSHIDRIKTEDAYARSRNNQLPDAPHWMRSDGLGAADWQVVAEYMDVLGPLKECTKRLEGGSHGQAATEKLPGRFGSIAEVIPVFEHLLSVLESRLQTYDDVCHDAHDEAPEDHLPINLRAAIVKARDYYSKLDDSPAYYAATILHPRYKRYCDLMWEPAWLESNNCSFQALWAEYKVLPRPRTHIRRRATNIDEAIDSIVDEGNWGDDADDEFEQWKRCEPVAPKGSEDAKNPIKYWINLRDRYPNLSKLALDILSIPASSCECERVFSELGDLLEPRRRGIAPELLSATHCTRRWRRAGIGGRVIEVDEKALSEDQMNAKYGANTWERS
jgi:hypothetical protein